LGVARGVHRDAGEWPLVRTAAGTVDAIPAMDVLAAGGTLGSQRPGFRAFWIVPTSGSDRIHLRQARRASEDRGPSGQVVVSGRPLGVRVTAANQERGPALLILGAVPS